MLCFINSRLPKKAGLKVHILFDSITKVSLKIKIMLMTAVVDEQGVAHFQTYQAVQLLAG